MYVRLLPVHICNMNMYNIYIYIYIHILIQVKHLTECVIQAAMCSPQTPEPWRDVWERAVSGELALCYLSPELAQILIDKATCQIMEALHVTFLVV